VAKRPWLTCAGCQKRLEWGDTWWIPKGKRAPRHINSYCWNKNRGFRAKAA
jgi:hypothetical protein